MLANRQPSGTCRSRDWRGLLSVLLAAVYLLASTLHGSHDIDVTTPGGGSEIASVLDAPAGHSDHKSIGSHHCHGCFAVSVAAPPQQVMTVMEPKVAVLIRATAPLTDTVRGLDPPPPKSLT